MAYKLRRNYIGFEISPRYADLARQRVARTQQLDELQPPLPLQMPQQLGLLEDDA
jgi:hypothetical protein